jgi:hypothetical protein
MNLKELLFRDFGIVFPISGGIRNSRDNPVIVHRVIPNDYTSVEYGILQCLAKGRGIEWKLVKQALLSHEGQMIDQIKIETVETTDAEIITQVENYDFDVTECLEQ